MSSTIHHLEMTGRDQFQPGTVPMGFELQQVNDPAFNERLYREVGEEWQWRDRLGWAKCDWQRHVERDELETWQTRFKNEEAGYLELERQENGVVEILYFGLRPAMIGKGLGRAMLTLAVERAWMNPATRRVWLHTCSEDHEHALSNYQKRGFRLFKTEVI